MKYTDHFGDPMTVTSTPDSNNLYIKAEKEVSLTPGQVIKLRKQLKKWLKEKGHFPIKT